MTSKNKTKLIFILSCPRSGSTLLQRILTSHKEVSSTAEPWILLPFIYTMKENGVASEFGHANTVKAIKHFYSSFPKGEEEYHDAIRNFALTLYEKFCPDSKYFLDKTPRYSLIAEEIYQLFPNEKFIVLWRNPLAIVASVLSTWKGGKWGVSHVEIDLYEGLDCLVSFCRRYPDKIFSLKYEDIVMDPEKQLYAVFKYLELEWDENVLTDFNQVGFVGMGDPTGVHEYNRISTDSCEKWKSMLASPLRKWWCRRYLRWLGDERLSFMGYDLNNLIKELDAIPLNYKFLFSDMFRMPYGKLNSIFDFSLLRGKIRQIRKGKSPRVIH